MPGGCWLRRAEMRELHLGDAIVAGLEEAIALEQIEQGETRARDTGDAGGCGAEENGDAF